MELRWEEGIGRGLLNVLTLHECQTFVELMVRVLVRLPPFCRINQSWLLVGRMDFGNSWLCGRNTADLFTVPLFTFPRKPWQRPSCSFLCSYLLFSCPVRSNLTSSAQEVYCDCRWGVLNLQEKRGQTLRSWKHTEYRPWHVVETQKMFVVFIFAFCLKLRDHNLWFQQILVVLFLVLIYKKNRSIAV